MDHFRKGLFFLLLLFLKFAWHVQADTAVVTGQVTNPNISVLPLEFTSGLNSTNEVHQHFEARIKQLTTNGFYRKVMEVFELNRPSNINGLRENRQRQMKSALKTKVIPHIATARHLGDRFQISSIAILTSILAENTLATNNGEKLNLPGVGEVPIPISNNDLQEKVSGSAMGVRQWIDSVPLFKYLPLPEIVREPYKVYEEKVAQCERGDLKMRDKGMAKNWYPSIGLAPTASCSECKSLPLAKRLLCYGPYIGEVKIPGMGGTYGPAQIHLSSAAAVADVQGLYGVNGFFTVPFPEKISLLLEDLTRRIMRTQDSLALTAATMALGSQYYAEAGWNIRNNVPVLVTLQHIGKLPTRVSKANAPGPTRYYPAADRFGVYSVYLEPVVREAMEHYRQLENNRENPTDLSLWSRFLESATEKIY